jgi:hypothetical protein
VTPDSDYYLKYVVNRVDGKDGPGEKHDGCEYFVLDLTHDLNARTAFAAYAEACHRTNPDLAASIRRKLIDIEAQP